MVSLLITIDVESDMPRWVVEPETTVENLKGIPRFQAMCDRLGVQPTYLMDYPVATRPEGEVFRAIVDDKRCELGAHLHPWTCPPYSANEDRLQPTHPSRHTNSVQAEKLTALTEAIEQRFGQRPTSYRAGRFGLNGAGLQILERLGYTVDTSATPFTDWTGEGGVDWRAAPEVPYFPDRQQPWRRGSSPILEVPVSIGWSRHIPDAVGRAIVKAPRRMRLVGLLNNPMFSLARLAWLYPSRDTLDDMKHLAEVQVTRGVPFLNVFFHSSEIWPGQSIYTRTEDDLDQYLNTLEEFFRFAIDQLGAVPRTLRDFRTHHLNEPHA
ncbi:MAG: hypothetical protein ACE366_19795 [Bradymonadia bacterium]